MPDRSESERERVTSGHRRTAQHELAGFVTRLKVLLLAIVALVALGGVAFAIAEHVSVAFGLVWTLDTITTVGTIAEPHDTGGRVIIAALELLGIGTLAYGLATVAEFFVSGQLSGALADRRLQKMIETYSDHYIICGYGRVGSQVARDLRLRGARYVVIDNSQFNRDLAASDGVPHVEGSASEDDVLIEAGIERASAVIACVDSDAENIFITLSARELRSEILIIARASAEDSEKKLLRAGADRVISPYKTTGTEMARIALHPQVGGAVEVADFRVEQIEVPEVCAGVGHSVAEVRGRSVIVALRRHDGTLEPQPSPDAVVEAGDTLIALGSAVALDELETVFQPMSVTSA